PQNFLCLAVYGHGDELHFSRGSAGPARHDRDPRRRPRRAVAGRGADPAAVQDGLLLAAALTGQRSALTDLALLRALATHPLLTLKVVGAIHWHALRLLLKGLKLRPPPV